MFRNLRPMHGIKNAFFIDFDGTDGEHSGLNTYVIGSVNKIGKAYTPIGTDLPLIRIGIARGDRKSSIIVNEYGLIYRLRIYGDFGSVGNRKAS